MAESEFGIEYAGPELDAGTMPVRDLAPALLAMGELVAAASLVVYPERPPVALNIKATEPGSFVVRLILESKDAGTASSRSRARTASRRSSTSRSSSPALPALSRSSGRSESARSSDPAC